MNEKIIDILEQAKALTPEELETLVAALTDGKHTEYNGVADAEVAKAWDEEIERRVAALDRGEVEVIDAREVTFRSARE